MPQSWHVRRRRSARRRASRSRHTPHIPRRGRGEPACGAGLFQSGRAGESAGLADHQGLQVVVQLQAGFALGDQPLCAGRLPCGVVDDDLGGLQRLRHTHAHDVKPQFDTSNSPNSFGELDIRGRQLMRPLRTGPHRSLCSQRRVEVPDRVHGEHPPPAPARAQTPVSMAKHLPSAPAA